MSKMLRALVVEDSVEDTELLLSELRRGGYNTSFERVETADTMSAALERQDWDIVFGDYRMPRFNGAAALKRMAFYDPLTDLPNRNMLTGLLSRSIQTADGTGHSMALILLDLSRFNEINDTLGHRHGDRLLKEVGIRLKNVLFVPDMVARLAGDEFAVLLPKLAKREDIDVVIKKIRALCSPPSSLRDCRLCWRQASGLYCTPAGLFLYKS